MNVRQVIPRDAIPSVDDPSFVDEYDGDPTDEVIVLEAGPRAYPVRYLHYHEIVNDRLGEDPVAVTWCPLCGSAVVYDRRVDGRTLEFGVSGKLADDDLVMYDRQTESEWKQSTGEAIAGPYEGERLTILPSALTSWERFAADHPDGEVLAPPGGESEASGPGDDPEPVDYDAGPYEEYFTSEGFGLGAHRGEGGRTWDREDLDPKAVVLGIEHGGEALGFVLERVREAGGVVRANVDGLDVAVFATGEGIFAYEDPGLAFEPADPDAADEPVDTADETHTPAAFAAAGTTWDPASGESADGRRLERVPARRLFAFAWQDDHGPDSFHR